MPQTNNPTWTLFDAGRERDLRSGYLQNAATNERFYRGDQWKTPAGNQVDSGVLPTPVFNVIRRVVDYLVSQISSSNVEILFSDDNIALLGPERREKVSEAIKLLNRNASIRWEKCRMDRLVRRALLDAALSGDGVFFTYWDPDVRTGQALTGDFVTTTIDAANLHVANPSSSDIQTQEYIIVSGRDTIHSLRAEALAAGIDPKEVEKIVPDDEIKFGRSFSGDGKATYLIKFTKDHDGRVWFEKSTKNLVIRTVQTDLTLYPVASFCWIPTKNSCRGASPVTGLIGNQKYINKAYALLMKHMIDTAFSKVIYDKTRIPEWTNEVGEAIGVAGGDLTGIATTFSPGAIDENYPVIIDSVIKTTKEVMGATEAALGEAAPNNTSAIIALQESNEGTLDQIRVSLYTALEELASIWVDFMCAYYADGRMLCGEENSVDGHDGGTTCLDCELIRGELIRARVDIAESNRYSKAAGAAALKALLDGGHITVRQYLERLPDGIIPGKESLIEELKAKENENA